MLQIAVVRKWSQENIEEQFIKLSKKTCYHQKNSGNRTHL